MTVNELCEPVFAYVCQLSRLHRNGGTVSFDRARLEIDRLREEMARQAEDDPRLLDQYNKVKAPLLYFIDDIVAQAGWPISEQWNNDRLAFRDGEYAGNDRFFELLDETLEQRGQEATERLEVFYTCMGLGFTGSYALSDPQKLRLKMSSVADRLGVRGNSWEKRVCPEAYKHTDTRVLTAPPGGSLFRVFLLLLASIFLVFFLNVQLFKNASAELRRSLKAIEKKGAVPEAATRSDEKAEQD